MQSTIPFQSSFGFGTQWDLPFDQRKKAFIYKPKAWHGTGPSWRNVCRLTLLETLKVEFHTRVFWLILIYKSDQSLESKWRKGIKGKVGFWIGLTDVLSLTLQPMEKYLLFLLWELDKENYPILPILYLHGGKFSCLDKCPPPLEFQITSSSSSIFW